MGVKKYGNNIHGILVLDKPLGVSSNGALQRAKRLLKANKAGHTGSLDPEASGVLPICFGEATKFSQFLLTSDKTYLSTFRLGAATNTFDAEGEVTAQTDASHLSQSDIENAIKAFVGDIDQVPPMVSALKKDGQPLYKLARQGIEIDRPARRVTIDQFKLLDFRPGARVEIDVEVSCSKGTYIRSLAHDLGEALAVGGHVSTLRRTQAGPFNLSQAVTMAQLELLSQQANLTDAAKLLLPVEFAVRSLPICRLNEQLGQLFMQGRKLQGVEVYPQALQGDKVRVFLGDDRFLGVGLIDDTGRVTPNRLLATGQN